MTAPRSVYWDLVSLYLDASPEEQKALLWEAEAAAAAPMGCNGPAAIGDFMGALASVVTPGKPPREAIGDEIERLIGLLDAMDGEADYEANGDLEPDASDENVNRLSLNPPSLPAKRIRRVA